MFDESRLKDPGYFRENRLDPHADYTVYSTEAEGCTTLGETPPPSMMA